MATDYKTIIDNIKSILEDANTTTADYYLSKNMDSKVQLVSKRNPMFIAEQPSHFPAICLQLNQDDKSFQEIGRSTNPKQAEIEFNIVGMIWYNMLDSNNPANDPADDEIHYFAENTEEVLRKNANLNNNVLYSFAENISFYEDLDEQSYFRTFVMRYKARKFY